MDAKKIGFGKLIIDSNGDSGITKGLTEDGSRVVVQLSSQKTYTIPIEAVVAVHDNKYLIPLSFEKLNSAFFNGQYEEDTSTNSNLKYRIPVVEEIPNVTKRVVETEKVKVKKTVQESQHSSEELLSKEEVVIERVPIDEIRTEPASVRYEGDTIIIPIQEEVLVIEKKIKVREELHIKKQRTQRKESISMNLKKEDVTVERKKLT